MAKTKKTKEEIDISFYLDTKRQFALDCEIYGFFWGLGGIKDKLLKTLPYFIKHLIWRLRKPNKYYSRGKRISRKRFESLENELKRIKEYEIDRWLDTKIWGKYIA